jgi:predicted RNase H-like HicB family nuclease
MTLLRYYLVMSTETSGNDDPQSGRIITLTQADDGWWVAHDEETDVASQGETRQDALDNLDKAVALHKGEIDESIDSWDEEEKVLEDLGVDPDEVAQARDEHDGLPDFMQ